MIKPFLKHTGAKIQEFILFHKLIPNDIEDYYEPFLGGGSVMLNVKAERYIVNDLDRTLYIFWNELFQNKSVFVDDLETYYANRFMNLDDKSKHYLSCKQKYLKNVARENPKYTEEELHNNFLMEAFYYKERDNFNINPTPESVFFVKEFCYQGMDRYSKKTGFNVPYGGLSYSKKSLSSKFQDMRRFATKVSEYKYFMFNESFTTFMDKGYGKKDFIFLDPPYTTKFSTYGNNNFGEEHHIILRDILLDIDARFMLVINKDEFTTNLYKDFNIPLVYNKDYKVKYKNRANSSAQHMVITNY